MVVVGLVSIFAAVLSLRQPILSGLGRWLDVGQSFACSDIVMILNGDQNTRPFAAIDEIRKGNADRILITSSRNSGLPSEAPRVHEAVQSILIRCGIEQDQITFIDSQCGSTFDEATTLDRFLQQNPDTTVTVVTNDFHTRRARWVFNSVLGPRASAVQFVSAKTDEFDSRNWWQHESGFVLYMIEFPKLWFYQVRYGRGLIWIAAAVVIGMMGWLRIASRRHNLQNAGT